MTDDALHLVVGITLVLVFAFGGVTGYWVRGASTPAEIQSGPVKGSAGSALSCSNGKEPRVWTRAEAEARYESARAWHRTSEQAGVWNGRGARAFRLAALGYLEILACNTRHPKWSVCPNGCNRGRGPVGCASGSGGVGGSTGTGYTMTRRGSRGSLTMWHDVGEGESSAHVCPVCRAGEAS